MNKKNDLYILNLRFVNEGSGVTKDNFLIMKLFLENCARMESPCILFGADSLAVAFKFGRSFRDAEMIIHPPINDFAYSWTGDFDYLLKFCAKAFPDHDVVLITDDQEFAMATQRLNVVFRVVLDASHVPEGSRSANGYPDLKACGIGIADSLEKATFTELEVVR